MQSPQTGAYCKLAKCFMQIHFFQYSPWVHMIVLGLACTHTRPPISLLACYYNVTEFLPTPASSCRSKTACCEKFHICQHVDEDGLRASVSNSILDLTELGHSVRSKMEVFTLQVSISEGFGFSTSDQLQKCQQEGETKAQ